MRKILFYCLIIPVIFNSCASSNTIKKTISQKYYNLVFNPEIITKQCVNKTEITIVPVDAKSLNRETYEAAYRDGNYEKEFISTIENWKTKLATVPRTERILLQGKINAFDCLSKLEKDGKIPVDISLRLKRKIIDEKSGKDGTEVESLSDIDIFPFFEHNPYKINENYFSVFKLTFENKGQEIEKISLKEFQLVSDEEQLYPLASDYFEKNLTDRTESVKNAYRMNMPNELIVTPGQRITKYIAVPAINTQNNKLQVQFIRDTKVVNFDFAISKKETAKTYNLERYSLGYGGDGDDIVYKNFFVVGYKDNVSYALRDNKLFVSEEKKSLQAFVYAIGINTANSEIVFGSDENFTFSTIKSNKKKIEFYKIKKDKKTNSY
ncbi:MAG: hypothetical protein ABI402_08920 [Ferruginibacter sp.]